MKNYYFLKRLFVSYLRYNKSYSSLKFIIALCFIIQALNNYSQNYSNIKNNVTTANPVFQKNQKLINYAASADKVTVPYFINQLSGSGIPTSKIKKSDSDFKLLNKRSKIVGLNSKRVYCYVAYDPTGKLTKGPAYFDLDDPGNITLISNNDSVNFISCGTWAGSSQWIGIENGSNYLVSIDTITGNKTILGWTLTGMTGLAYDYKTETLFGISYDGVSESSLYRINIINGKAELVGKSLKGLLINLACDTVGNLYSMNTTDSSLYAINKITGIGKLIGYVGFKPGNVYQDMKFDPSTNICYMTAYNASTISGELRTVDIKTGMTTLIGTLQDGAEISGLAIPFNYTPTNSDVQALSIDVSAFMNPGPFVPKASVINRGKAATFNVTMVISNQSTVNSYQSTKTVSNLAALAGTQVTFDQWNPTIGKYKITVYTSLTGDDNSTNDTIVKVVTIKNLTKAYCYNAYDPSNQTPLGPAYFYLENPDSIISIANQSNLNFVFGGTWGGDDKWYGVDYNDDNLVSIDTITGNRTILGWTQSDMIGLTYDYKTETLFGIAYDGKSSSLYKIVDVNGKAELIGKSVTGLLVNLASDTSGNLYSLNLTDSSFYSINKNTGLATLIGYVGFKPAYAQDMKFDPNTNICYMAAYNGNNNSGELRTVDIASGMTTLIGAFQGNAEITGFAIPYHYTPTNKDVQPVSIDVPLFINPETYSPKATILNNGKSVTFTVTMKISDGYSSTKTLTDLAALDNKQITFDPWKPAIGKYTIKVTTNLTGDDNPSNDTISMVVTVKNPTKVYCYTAFDPFNKIPEGPAYFYLEHPDSIISIADQSTDNLVIGSTWVGNNKWYGAVYKDNYLVTLDTITGIRNVIGGTAVSLTGIAYYYKTNTLYGVDFDGIKSSLYKISLKNGLATLIGKSISGILVNLACDTSGNLYSLNTYDDSLCSINKNTGKATQIGYIGFSASYAQGMDFDHYSNNLYLAGYNVSTGAGELRLVNVKTGGTTLLGTFQDGCEIAGFSIPYDYKSKLYYDVRTLSIDEEPVLPSNTTIMPRATVQNLGDIASFYVTMNIYWAGTNVAYYSSTRYVSNLDSLEKQQLIFDPWEPPDGDFTISVSTQFNKDKNHSNDTLSQPITVENLTKVFGYLAFDKTTKIPVGPAYTYLEAPVVVNSISGSIDTLGLIEGGTWGGLNKWYATAFNPNPNPNLLITIDTANGQRTVISALDRRFSDISFDYSTNTLYGIYTDSVTSYLYKISIATGHTVLIGPSVTGVLANLACDINGNLYSVNITNDTLYSLNKKTGLGTPIGNIGFDVWNIQGMEFDRSSGICYLAAYNANSSSGELRTVNLKTGNTTLVGPFGGRRNVEITGFAIPYKGKIPSADVGVTSESAPVSGCGLGYEYVTVMIENMGSGSVNNIPVHYSVDGGNNVDTVVTLSSPLLPNTYCLFTFSKPANLSAPGIHNLKAYTSLPSDNNHSNDTLSYYVNNSEASNVPYYTGFESDESLAGWTIIDANEDGNTWQYSVSGGHDAPGCVEMISNTFRSCDDWLISNCISLEANITYDLSFWYKSYGHNYPEQISVFLLNAPALNGVITMITNMPSILDTVYTEQTDTFSVPTSGVYYIGFHNYSTYGLRLWLDDINISESTGIKQLTTNSNQLLLYPNPADNFINILSSVNIMNVRILNLLGQEISTIFPKTQTLKKLTISTNNYPLGVYFVQIETSKGITTRKILITK